MSKPYNLRRRIQSAIFGYGFSVVAVAISTAASLQLEGFTSRTPLFFPAILLSTWFGGTGPGLLSVLLSMLSINFFWLEPRFAFAFSAHDIPHTITFLFSALLVSWWSAARRRAEEALRDSEQQLRKARDELEAKVEERTADLRQSNEQLRIEVAERQRAEQALREQANLLNLTHDTIFVRDMNDAITYWNRGAEELYGWSREQALGRITHELMQTVFPASLEQIQEDLLWTGRWEGELVHTKADGTRVVVASRWSLQRDEQNRPIAILETNNDVTKQKRAEEALRRAEAALAHVTRASTMGELAGSIAHEVNQPLTAVVNNANACLSLLATDAGNLEEVRHALGDILNDAERASAVVDRVRALVKRSPLNTVACDLRAIVVDVLALTRHDLAACHVTVRKEFSENLPLVSGDQVQLQQVLLNLVVNAMDAMSEVKEHQRLLVIRTNGDTRQSTSAVTISVRDSGVGLKSGAIDQLFEAFYTTKPKGLGMGLAISRSIIEAHGGQLSAEPNEGPGATFSFWLPAIA